MSTIALVAAQIPLTELHRADSLTHWRRLTGVYCFPFLNTASNNGNTGFPTVGYHATQEYRRGEPIHGNIEVT
jgi:hypothetical protein